MIFIEVVSIAIFTGLAVGYGVTDDAVTSGSSAGVATLVFCFYLRDLVRRINRH